MRVPVPQVDATQDCICLSCKAFWGPRGLFTSRQCSASADVLGRLRSFYRDLRNHALEFDPSIPPEPGFAIDGGVALGERRAGDRNLLIRVTKHTTMTDHGWHIWTFPAIEP